MTTLNSPNYASDWLKAEGDGYFSRDTGVLAAGQGILITGTVLAQRASDGAYVVATTGTSDGSQTALAILFDRSVDTTGGAKPCVVVARHATVMHQGLTFGPALNTAPLRAAATAQLALKGIVDRQGA